MEEYIGTISVPAIAVAVVFVLKLISYAVGKNKKYERFVPLISAGLGVVFGIVCFYALPAIIPAQNVVVAIVIGAASGFTAIGAGQMMKGLSGKTDKISKQEEPPTAENVEESEHVEELKDNKNSGNAKTAVKTVKVRTSAKSPQKKIKDKPKTTKTNKTAQTAKKQQTKKLSEKNKTKK